ncbi:prevent-host-death protein [Amycolatopsis sp. H6(2020)]|nr:prevent-host-death protein [Amycolatopsis sp. H6(2020)]
MSVMPESPTTVQSSDLSRNPKAVFAAAEETPVTVTRRDGESLRLMTTREDEARNELLEIAAHLIAVTTRTEGTLSERLSEGYPWMLALSPEDREACARELVDAARASFSTHRSHLAVATLISWKETATARAEGLSPAQDWLADPVSVERP